MIKITVVTVCYNSQDTIEKTVRSVLEQTYKEIEYIVVDGASKDNTLDIIRSIDTGNRILLVSEPDNGLYDAMNKAATMATGEYIIYMNSGDVFADKNVISDVADSLDGRSDLVYGNVIRIKKSGRILEKYGNRYTPMFLLAQGKMMSHQSIFTRRDVVQEYGFNTEYTITADYDFLMRIVHDKRTLKYIDINVSIVDNIEGISSQIRNLDEMRRQDDKSLKVNFPALYYSLWVPKGIVRGIKHFVEKSK